MKFNPSMIKMWSRIGSRASFGMAALELAKIHQNLIIILYLDLIGMNLIQS